MNLFGLLLYAFPPAFRARFGSEIAEQARAECARAFRRGRAAGVACALGTAFDLAWSGLAERWRPTWVGDRRYENESGGRMMMGQWIADLRQGVRSLRRSPGFTLAAVATLALALGVNAAIFSVVDAVLLRPLPYENTDRLVHIAASAPGSDFPDEFPVSLEFFLQYRNESTQLEELATFNGFTSTVKADDRIERLRLSMPTISLFRTLGSTPAIGRLPVEGEGERVALISHGLWTTWFGGDPSVLGRSYEFVGEQREIIGVMEPDFRFPNAGTMAWIPVEYGTGEVTPGRFGIQLVGRMAPDADHASLTRELSALASRLPELYGGSPNYARLIEQHVPVVRSVRDLMLGPVMVPLLVLMGAVGVVLLIACANIAGLFTVRSESRSRDMAVRRAIGAGRGALMRNQLSEAFIIAGLASLGALALARLSLPPFLAAAPEGVPRITDVGLSASSVIFTVVAAVAAGLLCGLFPAFRSSSPDLDRLRDGTRGSTRRRHWGRDGLVVVQTALALTLLVGSGLLLRSFQQLRSVDPGYDTEDILTFQFAPDQAHLTDGPSWARFHLDFMDRLRTVPGVEGVGIVENVPLDEGLRGVAFVTEGQADRDSDGGPRGTMTYVGGDYFTAMGIELLGGRAFVDDDARLGGNVVVSRAAADLLWDGEDPVGRQLRSNVIEDWHTVVGVVEDIRQNDWRDPAEPIVYYPMVGPTPLSWALSSPGYVVRSGEPRSLVPDIRALIREVAPNAPMYRVYTMKDLVDRSMVQLSFTMLTLSIASALALLLGAIGLYGVLSYVVTERTQEIGVRMALGAEASRVRRMVVGEGVRVVGMGIAVGLVVAFAATRALSSLLFGVASADPWTFAATSAGMAFVGVLASYVPARRASRVDPIRSMRGA